MHHTEGSTGPAPIDLWHEHPMKAWMAWVTLGAGWQSRLANSTCAPVMKLGDQGAVFSRMYGHVKKEQEKNMANGKNEENERLHKGYRMKCSWEENSETCCDGE